MTTSADTAAMLPLDLQERVIMIRMRETGSLRRHIFRRVDRSDYDAFYAAISFTRETKGEKIEDQIEVGGAHLKIYERCISRVEGYGLSDGRALTELTNWKTRVPGGHRITAAGLLTRVTKSEESGEELLDPEFDVISLDACWTEDDGAMRWHRGLLHRFTPPGDAHWKKLNNHRTKSVLVGGSRSQKTLYPKLNGIYADLYDELIVSVDGYSFNGAPLADKNAILAQMDCFHRFTAAAILFSRSEADAEEVS